MPEVRKLTGHTEGVLCLEFDDTHIVSGGYDHTIRVWNIKTGVCERVILGHEDSVNCLQFDKVRSRMEVARGFSFVTFGTGVSMQH